MNTDNNEVRDAERSPEQDDDTVVVRQRPTKAARGENPEGRSLSAGDTAPSCLELRKVELEERRFRTDIAKWVIVAIGTIVSFIVVDVGRLELEKSRSQSENQRLLLQEYLAATDTVQPDVWRRKLDILKTYSQDESVRKWAESQIADLDKYAARDALYRETVKVASQLVSTTHNNSQTEAARARFEQLYFADLPYVDEDESVQKAMVDFRNKLVASEVAPKDDLARLQLEMSLMALSKQLRKSSH